MAKFHFRWRTRRLALSELLVRGMEAETYFRQTVELVKKYNFRGFHWADCWTVWPCETAEDGHLPGKYSIYAQGERMVRFAQEMHEAAPGLMLGADSGLDNPQYGRCR